jgi:exodeoxyribonuclease V alpha subunit
MKLIKPGDRSPVNVNIGSRLAISNIHKAEHSIVTHMLNNNRGTVFSEEIFETGINTELTHAQYAALESAFINPLTIVDARPGHGKTHTIAAICQIATENGIPVAVGTFMGRAASRVSSELNKLGVNIDEIIGPKTLHSMLRISKNDAMGNKEIAELQSGIFIIDEASMLDVILTSAVFRNVPISWNIVMAGDKRQLQPINSGCAYIDIIKSGIVPVLSLDHNFRTDQFDIYDALVKIAEYQIPISSDNFKIYAGEENLTGQIFKFINEITSELNCNFADLLIATPQNTSKLGAITTNDLNKELKRIFNASNFNPQKWWLPSLNDRVYAAAPRGKKNVSANEAHKLADIQRAYNGELGTVVSIDTEEQIFMIRWDNTGKLYPYSFMEIYEDRIVELAYAVTVHKVQGAESSAIIFLIDKRHWNITNSYVYTACSRGKKKVVVINIDGGFEKAIKTKDKIRKTTFDYHYNNEVKECA